MPIEKVKLSRKHSHNVKKKLCDLQAMLRCASQHQVTAALKV